MSTKKMQQPLLYIHQPGLKHPIGSMQQSFIIQKNKVEMEIDVPSNNEQMETREAVNQQEEVVIKEDSKVMEFIIEEILTQDEQKEVPKEKSPSLTSNSYDKNAEREALKNEEDPVEDHKDPQPKPKAKRVHFNELSLKEKINRLKKMSSIFVKIIYHVEIKEKQYIGYFDSFKKGQLLLLPKDSTKPVYIPENEIINISIVGL